MVILNADRIIASRNDWNGGSNAEIKVGEWVNVHTWCLLEDQGGSLSKIFKLSVLWGMGT